MKNLLSFLVAVIFFSTSFSQKKAFTIADLYKIKNVGSPVVSNNGELIAFTVTDYDFPKGSSNSEIYVMKSDGTDIRNITLNDKQDYNPVWQISDKGIYFVSTRSGIPELFYYSLEDNKTIQITFISTGIDAPVISPDGDLVAFSTDVYPNCGDNENCNKEIDSASSNGPIQA